MSRVISTENELYSAQSLATTFGFELLGTDFGKEVENKLQAALDSGAVFRCGTDSLSIFRATVQASIRDIETHRRGQLFKRFLLEGPYEGEGSIPLELRCNRLTDDETAAAITFIYSFMVNSFKGAVAELLAVSACLRLMEQMRRSSQLSPYTRLYVGDAVMVLRKDRKSALKGADLHILALDGHEHAVGNVAVAGVVEVKSGSKSLGAMCRQLDRHVLRVKNGLRIINTDYTPDKIQLAQKMGSSVIRITVQPSDWKLPRTFSFEKTARGRLLKMDGVSPPRDDDFFSKLGDDRWHIALRWSKEAIAQAAYEMTFWYMGKVGESIYADKSAMPNDWQGMADAEAGRNAAKMMLYYAILRCQTAREEQRAIALYNSYSFGYALGMHFRNGVGKREMLWPEDLDEIHSSGITKFNCTLG